MSTIQVFASRLHKQNQLYLLSEMATSGCNIGTALGLGSFFMFFFISVTVCPSFLLSSCSGVYGFCRHFGAEQTEDGFCFAKNLRR